MDREIITAPIQLSLHRRMYKTPNNPENEPELPQVYIQEYLAMRNILRSPDPLMQQL